MSRSRTWTSVEVVCRISGGLVVAAYVNVVEVICNGFCSVRGKGVTRRKRIVCVWIA